MALQFAHGAIQWLTSDAQNATYTVSGLAFQPKAIRFYYFGHQSATGTDAYTGSVHSNRGIGFCTSTSLRRNVTAFEEDAAGTSVCSSARFDDCIAATITTATRDGALDINTITSDGFTLIVDDAASRNLTIFWEAWGGSAITVATCGDIDEPAATGEVNITVTGFAASATDQVVMFAGVQSTAATNTVQAESSGFSVGFSTCTAIADNAFVTGAADHSSATPDTDGFCMAGTALGQIALAGGNLTARARCVSAGTDYFVLNWLLRATTDRRSIFMALKGGSWKTGGYTIDGSSLNATATISSLTFEPAGVCLLGRMTVEQSSPTSTVQDRISLGTATSTSSRRSMGHQSEDNSTSASSTSEVGLNISYDQCLEYIGNADTVVSAYDINQWNTDGFQVIVDLAGGVASEWQGYLVFGNPSTAVQVNATVDALTLAEANASLNVALNIAAGVDAVALAELAASVNVTVNVAAGVDALAIAEYAASVQVGPAPVPTLVQHFSSAYVNGPQEISACDWYLPNAALSGNCLILMIQTGNGRTLTISDNLGTNTWSTLLSPTSLNGQYFSLYACLDADAGTRRITATPSGGTENYMQAQISEFRNIAQASVQDGSVVTASDAAPSCQCGPITTTVDGDLIWLGWAVPSTINDAVTGFTAATNWKLLSANIENGVGAAYYVQATHGDISPSFTTSGTENFSLVAVALKAADAGTAPTATPRIIHEQQHLFRYTALSSFNCQFPCTGDLLVASITMLSVDADITTISDGNDNTWSVAAEIAAGSGGTSSISYAESATTGEDMTGPVINFDTTTDTSCKDLILYDVVGAVFDAADTASGQQTSAGNLTAASVTPTAADGIAFNATGIDAHCLSGAVGSTFFFDSNNNPEADGSCGTSTSDNGFAHATYTTTDAVTFVYTVQNNGSEGVNYWGSAAAAFKPPAGGVEVAATVDALALAEQAASINVALNVSAGTESLALAEYAATINIALNVAGAVDALALAEYGVGINETTNVAAAADSLALAEYAAAVNIGINVAATVEALALAEYGAALNVALDIAANVDSLALAEYAASVATGGEIIASVDALTLAEYAATVTTGWKANTTFDLSIPLGSILDFASLKADGPAGQFGRVVINSDGHLAFANNPTQSVRFLTASQPLGPPTTPYPAHSVIDAYVEQLRVHGYNLARFHMLEDRLMPGATADFDYDDTELDGQFYLMYKLKQAGIYWMIDTLTDQRAAYANPTGKKVKENIYFDATDQAHWRQYVATLWNIENPYTGLTTLEDPALAIVNLVNEGGCNFVFRNYTYATAPVGLVDAFVVWLIDKYGDTTTMCAAWGDCTGADDLEDGWVDMPLGDSQISQRQTDMQLFFMALEGDTVAWMSDYLETTLGYAGIITNFDNEPQTRQAQASRSCLDLIDMHSYHDYPSNNNTTLVNNSPTTNRLLWMQHLTITRYAARPFTVSEYGHPFWNAWRHESGLVIGGYGGLQGWDMLCEHNHLTIAMTMEDEDAARVWAIGMDPIRRAGQTLAALLFLRGDMTPSPNKVVCEMEPDYTFGVDGESGLGILQTEFNRLGLVTNFGLHWSGQAAVPYDLWLLDGDLDDDPDPWPTRLAQLRTAGILSETNASNDGGTIFESDTEEILLTTTAKQLQVVTAKTEAVSFDTSLPVTLTCLSVQSASVPAMISASTMDGAVLADSNRILLMIATDAQNTGMTFEEVAQQNLVELGATPVLIKTIETEIRLYLNKLTGYKLYALDLDGTRAQELTVTPESTYLALSIDTEALTNGPTTFFELVDDEVVMAGAATFGLIEYAAAVNVGINVNAGIDNLTLEEQQATIAAGMNIAAGIEALALAEQAATVNSQSKVDFASDILSLQEYPAIVNATIAFMAGIDGLALEEKPANVAAGIQVTAGIEALTLAEHAAMVGTGTSIAAGVDNLVLTEHAAATSADVNINAGAEALALAENMAAVEIAGETVVAAQTDALVIAGHAANVNAALVIGAGIDAITLAEQPATVSLHVPVAAGFDAILLAPHPIEFSFSPNIQAQADALALVAANATIRVTGEHYEFDAGSVPLALQEWPARVDDGYRMADMSASFRTWALSARASSWSARLDMAKWIGHFRVEDRR